MDIQQLLHVANELGLTPLNLVLLAMLYFLGANHGFFPKWWGGESERPATKSQMDYLTNYYNHDTTELLQSIDNKLGNIKPTLESVEILIKELHIKQSEWEKYGIPARIKKDI